jgi:hypothetical protein
VDIETAIIPLDRWQPLHITQQSVEIDLNIFVTNQISDSQKLRSQPEHVKDEIKQTRRRSKRNVYKRCPAHNGFADGITGSAGPHFRCKS